MRTRKLRQREDGIVYLNEKDAFWQYILDHARPHEDGGYIAFLRVKSRKDFEWSIKGRQRGLYRWTEEFVNSKIAVYHTKNMIQRFINFLKSL